MVAIPPPVAEPMVHYVMDPHVEQAFWLIVWALLAIVIGWAVDVMIAAWRRNNDPRDRK